MRSVYKSAAAGAVAAVVCLSGASSVAQTGRSADDGGLHVVAVRPNFYVISGAGANIGVQIGPAGVVVVDTGSSDAADQTLAAIKRLTTERIRYILNTGPDSDHVGGNEVLSKAGVTMLRPGFGAPPGPPGPADVLMPESTLQRLLGRESTSSLVDYKSFTDDQYSMYLNGDGVQIIRQPAAHSDGDAFVFFRRSDVIMAGDIVDMTRFPVIDVASGGSIQGEIDALNRLLDMVVPPFPQIWHEDRTIVVPGHGHVVDWADLVRYRDMVTIVRDVVQDMIAGGMTLEQVQDANPTAGYRSRYGSDTGPWTTRMFVEAIYRSLQSDKDTR